MYTSLYDEQFKTLHSDLSYVNSDTAFEEFMTVYNFRGGTHVFRSLFEIQNFYYPDKDGNEDKSRCLLAKRDGYGCMVNNTEYQNLLDKKNILIDKRISEEEFYRLIGLKK